MPLDHALACWSVGPLWPEHEAALLRCSPAPLLRCSPTALLPCCTAALPPCCPAPSTKRGVSRGAGRLAQVLSDHEHSAQRAVVREAAPPCATSAEAAAVAASALCYASRVARQKAAGARALPGRTRRHHKRSTRIQSAPVFFEDASPAEPSAQGSYRRIWVLTTSGHL
jgi:hypothetical protein